LRPKYSADQVEWRENGESREGRGREGEAKDRGKITQQQHKSGKDKEKEREEGRR